MALIGRATEIESLKQIIASKKAELVVVYGRRRVGKTFLIKEYFEHNFAFYATGIQHKDAQVQLANFTNFINEQFNTSYNAADNWMQAFGLLKKHLSKRKSTQVIFIDELPWMDTKKSDLLTALDWFWNSWASTQAHIKCIVCGSAAAWMIGNLLRNKGGLYNRVTARIQLQPFTLHETEQFLKYKNIPLDRYQIAQIYMAIGGIPYYLEQLQKGFSAVQNIEKLCFAKGALLYDEFNYIFQSLFGVNTKHQGIIMALHKLGGKANREQLLEQMRLESSGDISTKLWELEESGFIATAIAYGTRSAKKYYYISDYYTLFYLRFIQPMAKYQKNIWVNMQTTQEVVIWQGLAFEQVCWQHLESIKIGLQIAGMITQASTWRLQVKSKSKGAQIDLVIDRKDKIINVIEIKFSNKPYLITKSYDLQLRNKMAVFQQTYPSRKTIWLGMLTTFGLVPNEYSQSIVQNSLTLDTLFVDA